MTVRVTRRMNRWGCCWIRIDDMIVGHIQRRSYFLNLQDEKYEYCVYGNFGGNPTLGARREMRILLGRFDSLEEAKRFVQSTLSTREEFINLMMNKFSELIEIKMFEEGMFYES